MPLFQFRKSNKTKNLWFILTANTLSLLLICFAMYQWYMERNLQFFSEVLITNNITETVRVHEKELIIAQGKVQNSVPLSRLELLSALRLAYMKTLAKRHPYFALAGVDTDNFKITIEALEQTRLHIAEQEEDPEMEYFLQNALYPTTFLKSARNAEIARRNFITSGSDYDAYLYRKALRSTFYAHKKDLNIYLHTLLKVVHDDAPPYSTARNYVTKKDIVLNIIYILEQESDQYKKIVQRDLCIMGLQKQCAHSDPSLPTLRAHESKQLSPESQDNIQNVLSFYRNLSPEPLTSPLFIFSDKSTCFHPNTSDSVFTFWNTRFGDEEIINASNVRFVDINQAKQIRFFEYFADLGNTYSLARELTHYNCLEIDKDTGRVSGMRAVTDFARTSPISTLIQNDTDRYQTMLALENALQQASIQEHDVYEYVREGLFLVKENLLPANIQDSIIDLAIQLNNNSAGFDKLVGHISFLEDFNYTLFTKKIHMKFDAQHTIYARSGIFALSATGNPSFAGSTRPLFQEKDQIPDTELFIYLTDIQNNPTELEKALQNTRLYFEEYGSAREN